MNIKLLTMKEKAKEMGIGYRWIQELINRNKVITVTAGKRKFKYFLPKLSTMELLDLAMDHNHVGNPCVCQKLIDEIRARQTKESTIL